MLNASRTLWSVINIPIPFSLRLRTISWISATAIGSIKENGSSRRISEGDVDIALAISRRLLSPPESVKAIFFDKCVNPNSPKT